jgi:hypothetical protein
MEHGVIPFFFSKLILLLSFSSCLVFETNLRWAGRVALFDSEAAASAASTLELGTTYDVAVAPGAHENEMKFDSFWKGDGAAGGLDIIEDNDDES